MLVVIFPFCLNLSVCVSYGFIPELVCHREVLPKGCHRVIASNFRYIPLGNYYFNISILIIVFVILMNQDYYFPLFGLFATAGKIFLLSEGGGEQSDKADPEKYARQRRGRFYVSFAAVCRHWQDWSRRLPLRKILFRRSHGSGLGFNGNPLEKERFMNKRVRRPAGTDFPMDCLGTTEGRIYPAPCNAKSVRVRPFAKRGFTHFM